jgi:hypothetical protein
MDESEMGLLPLSRAKEMSIKGDETPKNVAQK